MKDLKTMNLFFLLIFLLETTFGRIFRLMDPLSRLYFDFSYKESVLAPLRGSSTLQDHIPPDNDYGFVVLTVDFSPYRETKYYPLTERGLFTIEMSGHIIQKWRAEFLGRDLVIISSYDDMSECVTLNPITHQAELKKCRRGDNFRDQKFAITGLDGHWKGRLSQGYYDGYPTRYNYWGQCAYPKCLLGGFGSDNSQNHYDYMEDYRRYGRGYPAF